MENTKENVSPSLRRLKSAVSRRPELMKVAQVETHTKKLNYLISRQLEARIKDYITAQSYHIFVSGVKRQVG